MTPQPQEGTEMSAHTPGPWITENGMSLRDWFAGMALQGFLSTRTGLGAAPTEAMANLAYKQADAMLIERGIPS